MDSANSARSYSAKMVAYARARPVVSPNTDRAGKREMEKEEEFLR